MGFLYFLSILTCLLCIGRIVILVIEIIKLRREQMEFRALIEAMEKNFKIARRCSDEVD